MNSITTTINYIQFAKDYNFKDAWKIFPGQKIDESAIKNFLQAKNYQTISFECFYEVNGEFLIVGNTAKMNVEPKYIEEGLTYLSDLNPLTQFKNRIAHEIPDMARVGVLDYWFETGPCLVWKNDTMKRVSRQSVSNALKDYPEVSVTTLKPQGTSFYFSEEKTGQEHWIMQQTSIVKNGVYMVAINKVVELVNDMMQIISQ